MRNTDPGTGSPAVAIQVITAENDHSFTLNEVALERILLDHRVRDNKVVILSIVGAFRKGKSFLLDFFLRYLYARGSKNWIGDPDASLKGFPWKGGSERNTSGILMWSDPFEVPLPTGEKVCVLLMDTQGAFDSDSTVKDCATIFALSTMISSVQVFNLTSNIQEDDLQHLQLFTEYGRLALEGNKAAPFQDLHFLVRDWPYPYEYEYGRKGGAKLLEKRLMITGEQHEELQQLRHHLHSCFSKISCFLMPHPGLKVATNPNFDGRLADIAEEFKIHVQEFISSLLSPGFLVVKEINGSTITGKELIEYFKAYIKIFQGVDLPEPKSMLEATAEANNLAAVANAKDHYVKQMELKCGGGKPFLHPEALQKEHSLCRQDSVQLFESIRKMGGKEKSKVYLERLEKEIAELHRNYISHNSSKSLYASFQTPFILILLLAALYIVLKLFELIGFGPFISLLNFLIFITFASLITWGYSRVTGKYQGVGSAIDDVAVFIQEMVYESGYLANKKTQ